MNEKLCYFHLIDLNEQIFSVSVNAQNVYSFQNLCYVLMIKTLIIAAEFIKIWHYCFNHLHVNNIIQLFKNLWTDIKIKDTQTLFFYKICKLVNSKKKLFTKIMIKSQRCESKLHFNIDDNDEILNKFN